MPPPEEREPFLRALRSSNPALADLYEAGVGFAEGPSFPGRAPILAHVVRELRNGIPNAILGRGKGRLQYDKLLEPIHEAWGAVRESLPDSAQMVEPDATIEIPVHVARTMDDLLRADAAVGEKLRKRFRQMCAVVNGEEPWAGNELLAKQWMDIRVEGVAHRGSANDPERKAIDGFARLEEIVLRVFQYAPDREERVRHRALAATPETILRDVRELVTLHDHYVFFQALSGPGVLDALDKANLFTIPAEDSPVYWPPGDYLVNVAEAEPAKVAQIVAALKPAYAGTRYQILQGVLKLPDADLVEVARGAPWLRETPTMRYLGEYVDLVRRVAEAGEVDLATTYALRVLRLTEEAPASDIPGFDHPRAVPAVGVTDYERMLGGLVTALRTMDPLAVLTLLADKLDAALRIERYEQYDWGTPSLRDMLARESSYHDAKTQLAAAILALAVETAQARPDEVLCFLDWRTRNKRTYRRIAYALIVRHRLSTNAARVMSEDVAGWRDSDPEHIALVEAFYPAMDEQARAAIAALAHSTLEGLLQPFFEQQGREPYLIARLVLLNLVRTFGQVASAIPDPLQARIAEATAALQPEPPPVAPSFDHLATLTPSAVAAELHRWIPTSDNPFDTPWSVGSALRILLERNGADWLADIDACRGVPDYYLGWACNGLHGYRRTAATPNDLAILSLSDYALTRAADILQSEDPMRLGIARHTGQSVGLLLADIAKTPGVDDEVSRILDLARKLAEVHPTETPEREESPYSGPQSALGEPRALAVVVVAELLLRAHRHHFNPTGIADLYDSLAADDRIPVRGTLGQFFSWFATTHEARAEAWAQRIFLSGREAGDRAAWAGYVTFTDVLLRTVCCEAPTSGSYSKREGPRASRPKAPRNVHRPSAMYTRKPSGTYGF